MALIGKIRENSGLMVTVIGIALLIFIGTELITGIKAGSSSQSTVGTVFGEDLDYFEYNDLVNKSLQGDDVGNDPERRSQLIQQSWDQLINQKIFGREYKSSGIEVSGAELYNMFLRPGPNSELARIPAFRDSLGNFSPALVQRYLSVAENADPSNPQEMEVKAFMKNIEEYIYQNRIQRKYFNLVGSAALLSTNEARINLKNDNQKSDISFIAVNFNTLSDSLALVTDADLQNYLKEHREEFKTEGQTMVRFAKFPKIPAKRDSSQTLEGINKALSLFKLTKNDTTFVENYSGEFQTEFQSFAALSASFRSVLDTPGVGRFYGPVLDGSYYRVYKIVGMRDSENEVAKLRHILIPISGLDKQDSLDAEKKAKDLAKSANKDNFAQLAAENSVDFSTKDKGGDLGWLPAETSFGEKFDEKLKKASKGEIFVVLGNKGYEVVQVLDKSNKEFQLASIAKELYAGSQTQKEIFNVANRFASEVHKGGDIDAAVVVMPEVKVLTAPPITNSTYSIPGLVGSRDLINWARSAEEGAICEQVIETENAFVVAIVSSKKPKGYLGLEDVREQITLPVRNLKKAKMIQEKLAPLVASGDLTQIKNGYGNGAILGNAAGVSFNSESITGIGADYKVIGKVSALAEGQVSQPIVGLAGVYVIKIDKVNAAPEADPGSIQAQKAQAGFMGRQAVENKVYNGLKDLAEVEDFRYKFKF